jgi:hypothetical protein
MPHSNLVFFHFSSYLLSDLSLSATPDLSLSATHTSTEAAADRGPLLDRIRGYGSLQRLTRHRRSVRPTRRECL